MTIRLELSTEEQAALAAVAEAAGVSVETVLHGLVAQLSVPGGAEVPKETPAPVAEPGAAEEERREQEEVEANIKRWHQERQQI